MKKLTLTACILLAVGMKITAKPVSNLSCLNALQPFTSAKTMLNSGSKMRTAGYHRINAGMIINNGAHIANKSALSASDSSISKLINIQKKTKMKNAEILHQANEFVKKGNYESFLAHCTPDTKWVFVGERILNGKDEVREYMKEFYMEPPVFTVEKTIEEGNYVTVTGVITLKDAEGIYTSYDYCDIWRFEKGKIAAVKAFVIEKKS